MTGQQVDKLPLAATGSLSGESIALKDEESAVGTSKEPDEKEDALRVEGDPDCVTWKQTDFQVK